MAAYDDGDACCDDNGDHDGDDDGDDDGGEDLLEFADQKNWRLEHRKGNRQVGRYILIFILYQYIQILLTTT